MRWQRWIMMAAATLGVFSWAPCAAWPAALGDRRPNIILIITDDQRWDALGCMGNSIIHTPNIDRLAADGAVFTNMFCTTSICATSRASFLTGQYARRHGIHDFRTPLTPEQFARTFPVVLRKMGYRTGMVGKWGLGGRLPKDAYDEFYGFSGQGRYFPKGKKGQPGEHLTEKLAANVMKFLDGCSPDQPFLLQYYTKAAHCQDGDPWPFQPDPRYNQLFTDITIPMPKTATEAHFRALPQFLQTSEGRVRWKIRFATPEMFQKSVKDYYRLIAGIDDVVGQIMKKLKEKGVADNTVIIYTSDNGFFLGEHGLAGKWFMFEESIRLPLVIYDPRLPASRRGVRIPEIVLSIDIAPTIFELAGAPIPDDVQGQSLRPLLCGEPVSWRTEFFYEHLFKHPRIPQTEGVRTERWKYTRYISIDPVYEDLFDLERDPFEEHNLARDSRYADKLNEMRAKWKSWRERVK
ncbi:MAG: sulfatase [Planctomycetes bacterium]|nr:sulfatase [Planctomycetota bacterium]